MGKGYGEAMAAELTEGKRLGARGLKITKGLGLGYPAPDELKQAAADAIFADVDPEDWRPSMSSHAIFSHVFRSVREGAIVDLHDGYPPGPTRSRDDCRPTVEALGHLLPCLVDEGYELVTVSELPN